MEIKRFREILTQHLDFDNSEFKLDILENNVWMDKEYENGWLRFGFTIIDYGDVINLQGPSLKYRVNEIEKKIESLLSIKGRSLFSTSIPLVIEKSLNPVELKNNVIYQIRDEESAHRLFIFLKKTVLSCYEDFVAENNSIEKIYSRLRQSTRDNFSMILTNQSNTLFYRALIILSNFDLKFAMEYYEYVMSELLPLQGNRTFDEIISNLELIKSNHLSHEA